MQALHSTTPASTHGISVMQGKRPTQEDRHSLLDSVAHLLPQLPRAAFYAIYDGHLGTEASDYCAQHLPARVAAAVTAALQAMVDQRVASAITTTTSSEPPAASAASEGQEPPAKKAAVNSEGATDELLEEARAVFAAEIQRAFVELDNEFLRAAKVRKRRDGACVVSALLLGQLLVTAHLGDSRAILCKADGTAVCWAAGGWTIKTKSLHLPARSA